MTTKRGHVLNVDEGNAFGRLPDFATIRTWNMTFRIMECIIPDDYPNSLFESIKMRNRNCRR